VTRDEHGSASLFVLSVAALLVACSLAVLVVASLLVAHRRAASAADLAALAGADAPDPSQACASAASVAADNGADLRTCRVDAEGDVTVSVSRSAGRLPFPPVVVWARAGQPRSGSVAR
jgi:secretion/DNA translocation related TadE-like protein